MTGRGGVHGAIGSVIATVLLLGAGVVVTLLVVAAVRWAWAVAS